jgi:glycoprotein 6-alpha-L-fucosyltransferase
VVKKAQGYTQSLTRDKFLELLVNLYSLSQADYVVCTFTSNLCRFVYELMQSQENQELEASFRIKSLDNHFYADSFNTFTKLVIIDHAPRRSNEIVLKKGDIIAFKVEESKDLSLTGNLWNGYMMGINQRTNKKGIFPSYKVVDYFTNTKHKYYI